MTSLSRRELLQAGGAVAVSAAVPGLAYGQDLKGVTANEVRLGILHSLSGTFAIAETGMVDAEKLAIEEINAAGGVLGRKIVPHIEDGASEAPIFVEKANILLRRHNVVGIIGCYSSALRKAVLPAIHQAKSVLFYPTYYEGQEMDKRCMYTAQEATQSVVPAVEYLIREKGKSIFLVGSDYIYPVTCNKIAKQAIARAGGTVAGEEYAPLGQTDFTAIINKIRAAKPDAIYSTVVGGSNVAFYKQLKASGLGGDRMAIMSTLLVEDQVDGIGKEYTVDTYSCMGYFQSLKNPANEKFVKAFKSRYGQDRTIGYVMECGYNSVYIWKAAVEKAKSFNPDDVIAACAGIELDAPGGKIRVDDKNHHVWMKVRIGKARADGQFDIVHETPEMVAPNPFPKI